MLKPYQAQRLTGFTHPDNDPRGATYNLRQSIITVGAGGLRGRGVGGATQTGLDYMPEHATDFAFASLAEERGFFGASILLLLYLLIVWRALKIVAGARDLYCAIVAGGIAFMFLFQVFVNTRHDDGSRADHRHSAAVRVGRRVVADHELPRARRAAGDSRASPDAEARMKGRASSGRSR